MIIQTLPPESSTMFGDIIRRNRLMRAMSLTDLEAESGVSKPYLSLIETGRVHYAPRSPKLRAIEAALNMPAGSLGDGGDVPDPRWYAPPAPRSLRPNREEVTA